MANELKKPMLVFLCNDAQNRHAKSIIKKLGTKYKKFQSLEELKREVRRALIAEVVRGYSNWKKIINLRKEGNRLSTHKLLILQDKESGEIAGLLISRSNSRKAYKYIKEKYNVIRIPQSRLWELILDNLPLD